MNTQHVPVLLNEVMEFLDPQDGQVFVDGTFGRGGYTKAILDKANTEVIAIDQDPEAIDAAQEVVAKYPKRLKVLHGKFGNMVELLDGQEVDGIVLDIGVSSPQFDNPERGFSFQNEARLDMRMSKSGESAYDIVNNYAEADLANIIYIFGEEHFSRRIARKIVAERPITTTTQLANVIRSVVPKGKKAIDSSTKTFQALRIKVNDELGELERALQASETLLKENGKLAVVTFHSLEDRILKTYLNNQSKTGNTTNRHLPIVDAPTTLPKFKLVNKKGVTASDEEIRHNPRARSARLRTAIRINKHAENSPCHHQARHPELVSGSPGSKNEILKQVQDDDGGDCCAE